MSQPNSDFGAKGGDPRTTINLPEDGNSQRLLIGIKEVARLVGISPRHVFRRVSTKRFPQPRKIGRSSRWHEGELSRWIDAGCPENHPCCSPKKEGK